MFKLLKNSRIAALVAQAAMIVGALDLAHVAQLVPPKVGAVLIVIGGVAAQISRAFDTAGATAGAK